MGNPQTQSGDTADAHGALNAGRTPSINAQAPTNEVLAVQAQSGDATAISELWLQNRGLLALMLRRLMANPSIADRAQRSGVTFDDLMQESYFAIAPAVEAYKPDAGISFASYLRYPLMNRLYNLVGLRTQKQKHDPMPSARRFEELLPGADDGGLTLGDTVCDDAATNQIANVEEQQYLQQLHDALEACFSELDDTTRKIIKALYYGGKSHAQTAIDCGISQNDERREHARGLRQLRRNKRLRPYRDEIIETHAFHCTGLSAWKSGGSAEERTLELLERLGVL